MMTDNVARIMISRSGEISTVDSQWCGFLNEVKKSMILHSKSLKSEISRNNETLIKELDEKHREVTESVKTLHNKLNTVE